MIRLTKIFHFEMAHAIHGYNGPCKHIHGHSYELYVSVCSTGHFENYIPAPGFVIDFKELKKLVNKFIIEPFDHKLVLSAQFLKEHPSLATQENLVTWEAEPTAENLLLYIQKTLSENLPENIQLIYLKLYETKDSYAEWLKE
ncbi:MAG: 6-carboxytetrahydropterin synthase [Chitinophagaceae bacterium]|nr:6-carboxytetrahydropterin synthase [Chitinophagaceae bacterium]MDP1810126.1 6-carboxytetrahydropterin synthase [Sediminibacterium sp.]MDP3127832.1 6-carboxytetrahydropterin synthase [Sediminibacterium sp.]